MPLLNWRSSKKQSPVATPSRQQSSLLARLPHNQSSPAVYYSGHSGNTLPTVIPRAHRSTEYPGVSRSCSHYTQAPPPPPPPPYDYMMSASPVPTPSISWTSEMGMLADKIRDDAPPPSSVGSDSLDRWSISQGMKLVAIAADEYDDGNETVALDIYLSGVDKILMGLQNKTDERTRAALREKLTSVEERVGILNMAVKSREERQQHMLDKAPARSLVESLGLRRITANLATTISNMASAVRGNDVVDAASGELITCNNPSSVAGPPKDAVERFKQFGQHVINTTVTLAVLVKQSPLPDLASFIFGHITQMLLWVDSQYQISQKVTDCGVEALKLLIWADEQYRLHEFASEGLFMLITGGVKAAVAYKEAPSYRQQVTAMQAKAPIEFFEDTESLPPSPPSSSRASWTWSR